VMALVWEKPELGSCSALRGAELSIPEVGVRLHARPDGELSLDLPCMALLLRFGLGKERGPRPFHHGLGLMAFCPSVVSW
ncbi:hypothetical protein Dimus_024461, partial [Dionaea muscipula]